MFEEQITFDNLIGDERRYDTNDPKIAIPIRIVDKK